jgi:hypothetical protein
MRTTLSNNELKCMDEMNCLENACFREKIHTVNDDDIGVFFYFDGWTMKNEGNERKWGRDCWSTELGPLCSITPKLRNMRRKARRSATVSARTATVSLLTRVVAAGIIVLAIAPDIEVVEEGWVG